MKKFILAIGCLLFVLSSSANAATFNQVAAVVNGKMISLYDVEAAAKPDLLRAKLDPKNAAQRAEVEKLYATVLDNMILDILIAQEAERQKVTVSSAEVDAEIARTMQQSRLSKADFEKQLKKEGLTPDSLRDRIKKTIMRQKLMGMMVGRKVVVTPEEVKEFYDKNSHNLVGNRSVRMALLVYPDNASAADYAKKIKAGSERFEDVARKISIGPNKSGGGDIGAVPVEKLNPQWREMVSRMKAGDVTPLFVIEGKKAQLKLIQGPSGGSQMTLEEATPVIENILREPRLQERFIEVVDQLRKKAVIDIRM